jgi:hypothetical protein
MFNDFGFHTGVSGKSVDHFGVRQRLVQQVGRDRGAHHVVAALHDGDGDMADLVEVRLLHQEHVPRKEALVGEVVVLDARESQRELVVAVLLVHHLGGILHQLGDAPLPHRPGLGRLVHLCRSAPAPTPVGGGGREGRWREGKGKQ